LERSTQSKLKVLIAEDNAINRLLAIRLLQQGGHTLETAENGRIAVDKAQQGDFDLTIIATRATPDDERDYGVEDGGERSRNILAARPRKLT
jgi:CheY-like chemotaxis protein